MTPWTAAYQAPLSMGFSRQEYWSGLPFPSPGDLSNPGIEPGSLALQADALLSEPRGKSLNILSISIPLAISPAPFLGVLRLFFLVVQMVKHLPAMQETQVRSLGWEDPLEKGMATHSIILAWKIPWAEDPGGLLSH